MQSPPRHGACRHSDLDFYLTAGTREPRRGAAGRARPRSPRAASWVRQSVTSSRTSRSAARYRAEVLTRGRRARHHTVALLARGAVASSLVGSTLLFAACGGPSVSPGTPQAESSTTAEPPTTQEAPTSTTSARPADIDLTGKDPCTAIDPVVLGGQGYRVPGLAQKIGPTKSGCSFRYEGSIQGTALIFDTAVGAVMPNIPPQGTVVAPIEVAGYRAYTVQDQQLGGCTVKVDVHDGQTLSTSSNGSQSDPVAPLCDRAAQFAALALTGLARG